MVLIGLGYIRRCGDPMAFECQNKEGCSMYDLITSSVRIMQMQPFLDEFCHNRKNHLNCCRYKAIEGGKEPPASLLPNGDTLRV